MRQMLHYLQRRAGSLNKRLAILLLALAITLPATARNKPAYELILKIKNGQDTLMLLGNYYARGNQVVDTAYRDKQGRFVFTGNDTLPWGLYFFANAQGNYVEFVVYKEKPFFTFETDESDWTAHMQVKGSKENDFFYNFHRKDIEVTRDLIVQDKKMDSATFAVYKRYRLLALDSVKNDLIRQHPARMLSKMMLTTRENETPVVDENGDSLTDEQRRDYYFDHYFDNIPLEENFLVRTPKAVFYDRVMQFFDSYLKYAPPAVIEGYLDKVLQRARKAPDVFQYLVVTLTQKYLQSNVMVYDEVYVFLVQNYFATDDNFWSSPTGIEQELMRANKWERLLVGREAPELILFDTMHIPHSLHAMPNRWKLLIFWSPNCGHCKHVIPEVYKTYLKYRDEYDLGVFAILSEPDDKTRIDWRRFMEDHDIDSPTWINLDGGEANVDWHDVYDITSTPQIYLLDTYNVIQAKKLSDKNLEGVLQHVCGQPSPQE